MRRTLPLVLVLFPLAVAGCKTRTENPAFEKKWQAAKAASGLDDVQVIDTRSTDLKGNVQRLGNPFPPPSSEPASRTLPIKLSQNQVGRYIRRQLARLHSCYRATGGRSGRALLTLQITSSGRVASVQVEAPAFSGTRLARCLEQGALRWRFPRFQKGPLTYTYPFIFR